MLKALLKISFTVLILAIFMLDCKKKEAQRVQQEKEAGATVTLRNYVREAFNNEGILQWKLQADEAFVYIDENKTIIYNLKFDQFEKGVLKSNITGNRGEINHSEKTASLKGNIRVHTNDNKEIKTDTLNYNLEEKILTTDDDVELFTNGTTIYGKGLKADNNLNKVTIFRPKGISRSGNPLEK